jgi:hypothetical protein
MLITICETDVNVKKSKFCSQTVPYGSHNKQRLFPQTALTGCAL